MIPDSCIICPFMSPLAPKSPKTTSDTFTPQNLALTLHPHLAHPPHQHTLHPEPYATDSYQNTLFSLLLFRRLTNRYPKHMTIISHDFKRARFLDLHIPAIRWPKDRVTFIGIDPPESISPRKLLEEGERERGWGVWRRDLYGVGELLGRKRRGRGWREEVKEIVVEGREEGVRELLKWGGGRTGVEVFGRALPWDENWGKVIEAKEGGEKSGID